MMNFSIFSILPLILVSVVSLDLHAYNSLSIKRNYSVERSSKTLGLLSVHFQTSLTSEGLEAASETFESVSTDNGSIISRECVNQAVLGPFIQEEVTIKRERTQLLHQVSKNQSLVVVESEPVREGHPGCEKRSLVEKTQAFVTPFIQSTSFEFMHNKKTYGLILNWSQRSHFMNVTLSGDENRVVLDGLDLREWLNTSPQVNISVYERVGATLIFLETLKL
jgi:hypothetical protein